MNIDSRIEQVEQRLKISQDFAKIREGNEDYVGIGDYYCHDVTFLLSQLRSARVALTDLRGLHSDCLQCALTSGENTCVTFQLADTALQGNQEEVS